MATADLLLNLTEARDAFDTLNGLGYIPNTSLSFPAGPGVNMGIGPTTFVQPGAGIYDVFPKTPVFMTNVGPNGNSGMDYGPFDIYWAELFGSKMTQIGSNSEKASVRLQCSGIPQAPTQREPMIDLTSEAVSTLAVNETNSTIPNTDFAQAPRTPSPPSHLPHRPTCEVPQNMHSQRVAQPSAIPRPSIMISKPSTMDLKLSEEEYELGFEPSKLSPEFARELSKPRRTSSSQMSDAVRASSDMSHGKKKPLYQSALPRRSGVASSLSNSRQQQQQRQKPPYQLALSHKTGKERKKQGQQEMVESQPALLRRPSLRISTSDDILRPAFPPPYFQSRGAVSESRRKLIRATRPLPTPPGQDPNMLQTPLQIPASVLGVSDRAGSSADDQYSNRVSKSYSTFTYVPRPFTERTAHACDGCRQRRVKCDGTKPCPRCVKRRIGCVYSERNKSKIRQNSTDTMNSDSPPQARETRSHVVTRREKGDVLRNSSEWEAQFASLEKSISNSSAGSNIVRTERSKGSRYMPYGPMRQRSGNSISSNGYLSSTSNSESTTSPPQEGDMEIDLSYDPEEDDEVLIIGTRNVKKDVEFPDVESMDVETLRYLVMQMYRNGLVRDVGSGERRDGQNGGQEKRRTELVPVQQVQHIQTRSEIRGNVDVRRRVTHTRDLPSTSVPVLTPAIQVPVEGQSASAPLPHMVPVTRSPLVVRTSEVAIEDMPNLTAADTDTNDTSIDALVPDLTLAPVRDLNRNPPNDDPLRQFASLEDELKWKFFNTEPGEGLPNSNSEFVEQQMVPAFWEAQEKALARLKEEKGKEEYRMQAGQQQAVGEDGLDVQPQMQMPMESYDEQAAMRDVYQEYGLWDGTGFEDDVVDGLPWPSNPFPSTPYDGYGDIIDAEFAAAYELPVGGM